MIPAVRPAGLLSALLAALLGSCSAAPPPVGRFGPDPFAGTRPVTTVSAPCALTRRGVVPFTVARLIQVEVLINGGRASMVLDTGAERSLLTPEAAKRLGVTDRYDFSRNVAGIGAVSRGGDARLRSLSIGGATIADPRILVTPIPLPGADGLLGADLLGDFDLDLDGPRRQLTLYDRTECEDLSPPWPGRHLTLETTRSLDRHPFFPVQVGGHALDATIDTGAQRTTMSGAAAAQAGTPPSMLAGDPAATARGTGGETLGAVLHQFHSFLIGGDPFEGPVLVVPGIRLPRESGILIGLDYLLTRRIWLSYRSRRIFIARG
jgi:predicted aspartyl protease